MTIIEDATKLNAEEAQEYWRRPNDGANNPLGRIDIQDSQII